MSHACHSSPPETVTPEFEKKLDEVITHYPVSKRSASLPLLHLWQEQYGFISDFAIEWIAQKLGLQPINILELVTFYPMFRQHPAGKIQFKVCRTLSCALGGGYELCAYLKQKCQVGEPDEHGLAVSPDGKYSVEFVECLASCGTAPVMMVNEDFYEGVTNAQADELLKKYS
jgi:NADH-quinone oxidoreductase subunit E